MNKCVVFLIRKKLPFMFVISTSFLVSVARLGTDLIFQSCTAPACGYTHTHVINTCTFVTFSKSSNKEDQIQILKHVSWKIKTNTPPLNTPEAHAPHALGYSPAASWRWCWRRHLQRVRKTCIIHRLSNPSQEITLSTLYSVFWSKLFFLLHCMFSS